MFVPTWAAKILVIVAADCPKLVVGPEAMAPLYNFKLTGVVGAPPVPRVPFLKNETKTPVIEGEVIAL